MSPAPGGCAAPSDAGPDPLESTLVLRSVLNGTKHTTLRLEPDFWRVFEGIARAKRVTVNDLVTRVQDGNRGQTSSVRVFIVQWLTCTALAATASTEIAQGSPAPPRL